jgi:general stress protein 26
MEPLSRDALLDFMRGHRYAVEASVSPSGHPEAAVVGIVVTDALELFFDTLAITRKAGNLAGDARVAFVIGGTGNEEQRTVQYEGIADSPRGAELERLKELYFARFPEGRERMSWPGITYFRIRPVWIRYSDFSRMPPEVVEFPLSEHPGATA